MDYKSPAYGFAVEEDKGGDLSRHDALLDKYRTEIDVMAAALSRVLESPQGQGSFTMNPADGTVWTFKNPKHAADAFTRHSKDGHAVYFYSTMNGDEAISLRLKTEYARLLEAGRIPYIGRWINPEGRVFIDSVLAVDAGIDDDGTRRLLNQNHQELATKLEGVTDKNRNIIDVLLKYVGN